MKKILLIAVMAVFATSVFASNTPTVPQVSQNATSTIQPAASKIKVTGRVVDENGDYLVGVTIHVKGTTTGASTDKYGQFEIKAAAGATLVIAYIGFSTQEVPVHEGNKVLHIVLKEDTSIH